MPHETSGGIKTILCTIGTRPEAIKMAPVIHAFQSAPWARCRVLFTGQHRELVDPMLAFFAIQPDLDLDIMRPNQTLIELTARLLLAVHGAIAGEQPDMVLAQGDTTTVLATALASFYHKIPFGHVEAGPAHRTGSTRRSPRRPIASWPATWPPSTSPRPHRRAITCSARGSPTDTILVTGNTVIDALLLAAGRDVPIGVELDPTKRLVLVTAHRRDSFGEPIRQICRAIRELHDRFPDVRVPLAGPSQSFDQAGGRASDGGPAAGPALRAAGAMGRSSPP